jgi:hypothetical protein
MDVDKLIEEARELLFPYENGYDQLQDIADALAAQRDRIAELEGALTSMVGRYELYCGGPELPFAGHTDEKVMKLARAALDSTGKGG